MAYSWQNNKTQNIGSGKYSWQNGNLDKTLEEKVSEEKQSRISQGLPVSVKKTQAAPTLGGNIVRGAIMPFADVVSNLLGGANLSNKYLGKVSGLGQLNMDKPLSKENLKVLGKSVATGLEIGSYATGGGAVVGAGKNAIKQTAKEFIKTNGKQLAKDAAIASGLGSIGYQGREGKIDPLQVLRDTAIGAIAGPVLGVGANKLLGRSTTKVAGKVDEVIPPVKTKNINELVSYEGAPDRVQVDKYKKIIQEGGEVEPIKVMRDNTGTLGIEDGKHRFEAYKELGYKEVPIEEVQPRTQASKIASETPVQNQVAKQIEPEKVTRDIEKMSESIEGFDSGTFKQWSSEIRNLDMDEVTRVALGGKKTVENTIPKNAYLSVAKNIANETGDLDLAQRLATSNVKRKSGQELVASKLTTSDNIVDDLVEIKEARMKQIGLSPERFEKESAELVSKLKSKIEEIRKTKPSTAEVMNIINDLICK